jgi:glycosyltransferase involved in cell wall biosynthesis
MISLMGENSNRSSVIPHAAFPFTQQDSTVKPESNEFRVCYLGRVSKRQDIKVFLEGFAQFLKGKGDRDILFSCIGLDEMGIERISADLGIEHNVRKLGSYRYPDAMQYIMGSDVLLVVDPQGADGIILSSKISDYARSGRPILIITNSMSESRDVIDAHGGGIAVGYSAQEIWQALERMFSHKQDGTLDSRYRSLNLYDYFSPQRVIHSYEELFKRLVS